jgi:hypothetical protein
VGDYDSIFRLAKQRVTERLNDAFFALRMLPETFTMYELRRVHELFLGEVLDKRNFRKKIVALDQIEETGEKRQAVSYVYAVFEIAIAKLCVTRDKLRAVRAVRQDGASGMVDVEVVAAQSNSCRG